MSLTYTHILAANILAKLRKREGKIALPIPPRQWSRIGDTGVMNFRINATVGVFSLRNKTKAVIKQYAFSYHDLDYWYVKNEATMLNILQSVSKTSMHADVTVHFPRLLETREDDHTMTLIIEFAEGKRLSTFSHRDIRDRLYESLHYLMNSYQYLSNTALEEVGVRSNILAWTTFPVHFARALRREPSKAEMLRKAAVLFYQYGNILTMKFVPGLNHRDLHPDNILFDPKRKTVTLLDPECMVIGDELYDLALVPRLYARHLTTEDFFYIIHRLKLTPEQKKRIIPLMISGCIVKIATEYTSTRDYEDAWSGLQSLVTEIIPNLRESL